MTHRTQRLNRGLRQSQSLRVSGLRYMERVLILLPIALQIQFQYLTVELAEAEETEDVAETEAVVEDVETEVAEERVVDAEDVEAAEASQRRNIQSEVGKATSWVLNLEF